MSSSRWNTFTRAGGHVRKEMELALRLDHRTPVDLHRLAGWLDLEPLEDHRRGGLFVVLGAAAEHRSNPSDQFGRGERLGDIVIGASLQAAERHPSLLHAAARPRERRIGD